MENQTPVNYIVNWSKDRSNESLMKSIINASGNYFILDGDKISASGSKLHVYIATDSETLKLYAIPANVDKNIALKTINSTVIPITLETNNKPLSAEKYDGPHKEKAILLIDSVNNWNTTTKKAAWLTKIYDENCVPLAIEIDCSDFQQGACHACFFALKKDANNSYTVDLVIMNIGKDTIFEPQENGSDFSENLVFRDMARPVPPFGQEGHPSTEISNFGILKTLGIT